MMLKKSYLWYFRDGSTVSVTTVEANEPATQENLIAEVNNMASDLGFDPSLTTAIQSKFDSCFCTYGKSMAKQRS